MLVGIGDRRSAFGIASTEQRNSVRCSALKRNLNTQEVDFCSSSISVPIMSGVEQGKFTNARGQALCTYLNAPPAGVACRGILARHHGLGDHCMRFNPVAEDFAKEGYAVWSLESHGHGHSEPTDPGSRFAVRQFSHLAEDFEQFVTEVVQPWQAEKAPKAPIFFSGASLGALVVMHVAARGKVPQHAGLELSCAAAGVVKSPLMRVQEPFAALLNRLTPYAKLVPRLAPDSICVSEEAAEALKNDPLMIQEPLRVCTACAVLDGMNSLTAALPSITCPVLMTHGELDVTCPPTAARAALDRMHARDRTWVALTKARHNLQLDIYRKEWLEATLDWLNTRTDTAGAPVTTATATDEENGDLPPVVEIKI